MTCFLKVTVVLASTLFIPQGNRYCESEEMRYSEKCTKTYFVWPTMKIIVNKLKKKKADITAEPSLYKPNRKSNFDKKPVRNSLNPFPFYLCFFAWKLIHAYWSWNSAVLSASQHLKGEVRFQNFFVLFCYVLIKKTIIFYLFRILQCVMHILLCNMSKFLGGLEVSVFLWWLNIPSMGRSSANKSMCR